MDLWYTSSPIKKERAKHCLSPSHSALRHRGLVIIKTLTSGQHMCCMLIRWRCNPPLQFLHFCHRTSCLTTIGFRSNCTIIWATEYVQTRAHLSYHAVEINDAAPKLHGRMAEVALKAEEHSLCGTRKATTVKNVRGHMVCGDACHTQTQTRKKMTKRKEMRLRLQ